MVDAPFLVSGGCLCGAIRYEATEAPRKGAYCHCNMCKKSYGGLYMASVQFEASCFRFTIGSPKFYRSSDIARRGFCGDCGSPLVFVFDGDSEVWVLLGSLDKPEAWPLTSDADWGLVVHTQSDSMVPWHVPAAGLAMWTSGGAKFQQTALARAARASLDPSESNDR